ncbi:MAG: hypothetical protein ABI949_17920 [Ilumatobacteraceae bacterium]
MLSSGFTAALASCVALGVLGGGRAFASDPTVAASGRVSLVGDSLTMGTLPFQEDAFANAGWARSTIDAHGSRGVRTKVRSDHHTGLTAVDGIRRAVGDSEVWVIALGSNDAGIYSKDKQPDLIRMMMDKIGTGHAVMWVNIYLPRTPPRQQFWNSALDLVAAERSDEMFVYDWASMAEQEDRWLAHDKVHYSRIGYKYRSTAIALASRGLLPTGIDARRVGPRRMGTSTRS